MGIFYHPPNPNIGAQQPLAPKDLTPYLLQAPARFDPLYLTLAPRRVLASKPPRRSQVSIPPTPGPQGN